MGTAFHRRRPELPRREYHEVPYLPDSQGVGLDTLHRDNAHAAAGSTQLRDEINSAFIRFERKHGLKRGEGQFLLLDTGVKL